MNMRKILIRLPNTVKSFFCTQTCKDEKFFYNGKAYDAYRCRGNKYSSEKGEIYTNHTKRNEEHSKLIHMYTTIMCNHEFHKKADRYRLQKQHQNENPHNLFTL